MRAVASTTRSLSVLRVVGASRACVECRGRAPVDTVDIRRGQSELPGPAWHAKSEKGFAAT
jgi:hypothetical protein